MNEPYFITYSNHFKFNGETFAFRKKILFNITTTPFVVIVRYRNDGSKGTIVNGEWLSWSKMEELAKGSKEAIVDVSSLQWNIQEQLNHCFNLC
jgi:hypothetical protein